MSIVIEGNVMLQSRCNSFGGCSVMVCARIYNGSSRTVLEHLAGAIKGI